MIIISIEIIKTIKSFFFQTCNYLNLECLSKQQRKFGLFGLQYNSVSIKNMGVAISPNTLTIP